MTGAALAKAAENLIGTRFILHGRNPESGLDCIGLLAAAMIAIGRPIAIPSGYPLRVRDLRAWLPNPTERGLAAASAPFEPGDVVIVQPGAVQFHLAIAALDGGWIHAHAGLRRVVHDPKIPAGPLIHHWRLIPQT
ncbi:MAG: hypothetical protein ACKOPE_02490 [Novosphingobium sp.]